MDIVGIVAFIVMTALAAVIPGFSIMVIALFALTVAALCVVVAIGLPMLWLSKKLPRNFRRYLSDALGTACLLGAVAVFFYWL